MNEDAVRNVAEAMVERLAVDIETNADRLSEIGLELATAAGLTEQETAAAFDQAIARLKMLRLRVMHLGDQKRAAEERQDG